MDHNILRILDVNLNRATEGLRVVEEICRFILEDKRLTLTVKRLRGQLSRVMKAHEGPGDAKRIRARKAIEDVGREMYTRTEGKRAGVEGVFRANIKRAQEAIRCLEEFSKLLNPVYGKKFKKIRFAVYNLEKKITRLILRTG